MNPAPDLPNSAALPRPRHTVRTWIQRMGPLLIAALAVADFFRSQSFTGPSVEFRLVAMAPSTSLAFVLLSLALGLTLFQPSRRKRSHAAMFLCHVVVLMAVHVIVCRWRGTLPAWESWLWRTNITVEGYVTGHMSYQTAVLAMLSTFSLVALFSPVSGRPLLRDAGIVVAVAVLLFGMVGGISYAAGNPPAAVSGWLKVVPLELFGFIAFNLLLLLGAHATNRLRQWFFGTEAAGTEELPIPRDERRVLALLACAGLLALAASVNYLRVQTERQKRQALEAIQTMSDLKARNIVLWRRDRLADARMMAVTPFLVDAITAPTANAARTRLEPWLRALRANNVYSRIVVFNRAGLPLASEPARATAIDSTWTERLATLRDATDIVEVPPYADDAGVLHWDILVPVRAKAGAPLDGAIWLQTTPGNHILSALGWWPDNYRTGQTVLWYREGDRLTSLGGLRASPDASSGPARPFSVTRSISELPAYSMVKQALRGDLSAGEGLDQHGVPILGVANVIRNSGWFLTSRVDSSEVYATLRRDAWIVAGLLIGLLGTTGATTSWLWRQRQRNLVHERVVAELEQKRLAMRLGMVMRHAKEMIFLTDENRRLVDANQQAVDTYGWTKEELLRLSVKDLRAPEAMNSLAADLKRADSPEGALYETVHRRKDGSTFPVEISVRRIELEGERQVLSLIRDITERKRAEAALRASEERYRLIAENTSDVIWLYDQVADQFTYASPAALPMLGYQPEEIVGLKILSLVAPSSHDAARRALDLAMNSARGSRAPVHLAVELEMRRKDGRLVPVEVVTSVLADASGQVTHILGVNRDITERKKAREALEKFNDELEEQVKTRTAELAARNREIEALVQSIPDTVLLCDERGELVTSHFPQSRATAFPFASASREGLSGPHPVLLEIARELHAVAWASQQTVMLEFDRVIDGSDYSIEARATPAGENRLLILLRDISARKKVERVVQANLEREKQLSEMKSQFVSVASHEFRTPLAAATGSLELLERHAAKLTEVKRLELLTRAQRSLGRLTTIMDNVLQLSRADSGRVKVKRMVVDLVQIVQDLIREVEAGDRQQHAFVFNPSGKGDAVPVDTNLFNHILSNLLGNAVRYSPAGTTISVTLEIGSEAFVLTVADEGIGVPEAERDRVFEPFARGSNVGQINGTGLGLNIVKRYTEMMGGRIELLPTTQGAAFQIRVPVSTSSPETSPGTSVA